MSSDNPAEPPTPPPVSNRKFAQSGPAKAEHTGGGAEPPTTPPTPPEGGAPPPPKPTPTPPPAPGGETGKEPAQSGPAGAGQAGGGAKKPLKSIHQVEVDQGKVWNLWFTRREFLTLAAWGGFFLWLGGTLMAAARYFLPNITYDPPTLFKVGRPEDYTPGEVNTRFKKKYRIWIVRDTPALGGGLYAIYARCTHLGCTPNWLAGQNKFKCPCHGSGFRWGGINFEGPAPRPLERCRIALADDGQIRVDVGNRYKDPKDWRKPDAYLKV